MTPLRIAFIGYNRDITRNALRQFAKDNAAQVLWYSALADRVKLYDGTTIQGIRYSVDIDCCSYDQVIVADDERRMIQKARSAELTDLWRRLSRSCVPEEFQWQFYNLDAEEAEA